MKEETINKALKYAESSSKIEDMKPTSTELKIIKQILVEPSKEESFLKNIVQKVKEGKTNGKLR